VKNQDRELIELELLLLRCRRGRPNAFEELIARFERPLLYFIRRIVGNEPGAWDALQKTWIRVFAGLPKLSTTLELKAWLYRVARNTALNHVRDEGRHAAVHVNDLLELSPPKGNCFSADDAEEVHRALDLLDLGDREILTLHFLEEFSVDEVAGVLGIPAGTAKSRLHTARKRLRAILEKRHD
jgi:RNA polymerase sigma-70 factor (ECF subfamily)